MYAYDPNPQGEYIDEETEDGERYEVVTATQAYVEPFKHVELEGRLIWPSRSYFRALDADWQRVRGENAYLREALARSGNAYLLRDANDWLTRCRKLEMMNAKLRAQLEEERANHRIETMELEHRADFYEHRYNQLAELNNMPNSSRDNKSGRFKSSDGIPLEKKQDRALEMFEQHISYAEISRSLNIGVETAKIYIRKARDRRAHQKALESFNERQRQLEE